MAELLHEVWESPEDKSLEMCRVSPEADRFRRKAFPKCRLVYQFYAPSYNSAMQAFYDWANYGTYVPVSEVADKVYATSHLIKQKAYLQTRGD